MTSDDVPHQALYLADETKSIVRGMAEMTVIKLGEMVDKPQAKRIQMMARQVSEGRLMTSDDALIASLIR
jgi:hypothetical protein